MINQNPLSKLKITNSSLNKKIFLKLKVNSINSREDAKLILRKNIYIKIGDHKNIDTLINEKNALTNFK